MLLTDAALGQKQTFRSVRLMSAWWGRLSGAACMTETWQGLHS